MAKKYIISIVSVLLLTIVTIVGATYAYYSVSSSGNNNVQANSKKYDIVYSGGTHINGEIQAVSRKEDGNQTTVQIGLASGSASANATLYIKIENITTNLAISAFNWEVYRISGSDEIYVNSGNFADKSTNDEVTIVTGYPLSETPTQFKIYLWIDGNSSNNSIEDGVFAGYIGARTDQLTGIVKN